MWTNIFSPKLDPQFSKLITEHGPVIRSSLIDIILLSLLLAPFLEEIMFRLPIVLMSLDRINFLICLTFGLILNLIWAMTHFGNKVTFSDGYTEPTSSLAVTMIGLSGLFYMLLALKTKSVIGPIIAHFLWNFSVSFNTVSNFMYKLTNFN